MSVRLRQIETRHALLIKHHDLVKDQEFSHFKSIEETKKQHLDIQHDSEQQNQQECNKRALEEKRKEHALQSKQQPRELKVRCVISKTMAYRSVFKFKGVHIK